MEYKGISLVWPKSSNANHKKKQGYVFGWASELNKKYWNQQWVWHTLYRVGKRSLTIHGTKCHVSGVAIHGKWNSDYLYNPLDEHQFFLGDPRSIRDEKTEFVPKKQVPYGYPMHDRCWTLAIQSPEQQSILMQPESLKRFLRVMKEELKHEHRTKPRPQLSPRPIHNAECDWYRDPWKVPEVLDLFAQLSVPDAETTPNDKSRGDIITFPRIRPRVASRQITRRYWVNTAKIQPPPEVVLLILDHLSTCTEIRTLMWAFPHWATVIPEGYWRVRFIRELKLEHDEVPGKDALNWRRAYYMVDRLKTTSGGLRVRTWIEAVLERARMRFANRSNGRNR
ncbi:uncharacterized protein ATNIH1004_001778 [Aspergillus tanneri]|uniref:F-box domain-containing protein n=1 Tax=Aspergillus tanneri TaxID=1220188 RepID=A0A5M9N6Y8_9EURO|nr:uncharacterized protein ATNIH1004_001778 [Aspergillus tanneri]KAA8652869.1 hypothetical protein ATNIH1004_001778 [Aspergillus tanneri]